MKIFSVLALVAAWTTVGLAEEATTSDPVRAVRALPTCGRFLNVSISDPESPSPVELGELAIAVGNAIIGITANHAACFSPDGEVGMMRGGGLGTVGYSQETSTFAGCLAACYNDDTCLGFHWSRKRASCGLKAQGDIPVSTDNRYQKTFRSFRRLTGAACTAAITTEPTTTTSKEPTTTTTEEPTTTTTTEEPTTTTTTEEPTTTTNLCAYKNTQTPCVYNDYIMGEAAMSSGAGAPLPRDVLKIALTSIFYGDGQVGCAANTFDTSAVTSFYEQFYPNHYTFTKPVTVKPLDFNQNINGWNTGAVTTMFTMFQRSAFNQNINGWNTGAVTSMSGMFNSGAFNQNINCWNTSAVVGMDSMFEGSPAFNQNINNWNTGAVETMKSMFREAAAFQQNINTWNTGAVMNMITMFAQKRRSTAAVGYNQNINNWNTGAVTDMQQMFNYNAAFNQNINNWNTGAVTSMTQMFSGSVAFLQNINGWNMTAVTGLASMFKDTLMTVDKMPAGAPAP